MNNIVVMENWHVFENYEKKIFKKYYMQKIK